MEKTEIKQAELIMEYFKNNPNREIEHPEIVDWVVAEYKKRTGEVFRDPDRAIRKLHQEGKLIKIKKGVYKYDPTSVTTRELEDFTPEQKEAIFKRDKYKCVFCGRGRENGVEIHADHVKPKDLGGKAEIDNGQTLCSQHNFQKKNYGQTEAGKRYFIKLYEQAVKNNDEKMIEFCKSVFDAYDEHDINGHIPRPNRKKPSRS